jgi:hypothetical protein
MVGEAACWAQTDDSPEASPPVLKEVEFYPPPVCARGFLAEYQKIATRFDGESTSLSPLPFVGDAVLLNGVRADIQLHLKDFAAAAAYELLYEKELAKLLRVDYVQVKGPSAFAVASRFSRHRLARATSGGGGWRGGGSD